MISDMLVGRDLHFCTVPIFFSFGKFEWKTAVFREPINTEFHIWGKFDPKKQNCLFKIELGTWSSLNMLFDGDVHFFLLKTENTLSGQIWSKKPKLLVKAEVWHLVYFEYVELDGLNYF